MNKEEQIIELVKQVLKLKAELKDTSAAYRDQIKDLEREIKDNLSQLTKDELIFICTYINFVINNHYKEHKNYTKLGNRTA